MSGCLRGRSAALSAIPIISSCACVCVCVRARAQAKYAFMHALVRDKISLFPFQIDKRAWTVLIHACLSITAYSFSVLQCICLHGRNAVPWHTWSYLGTLWNMLFYGTCLVIVNITVSSRWFKKSIYNSSGVLLHHLLCVGQDTLDQGWPTLPYTKASVWQCRPFLTRCVAVRIY